MNEKQTPITINCDENKFVEAILLISKIKVDKEQLCTFSKADVDSIATNIIVQTCKALIDALKDEKKSADILAEFVSKSNLKYLLRALH